MTGFFRPVVVLVALAVIGVALASAGVWVGRREVEVKGERDREGDERFAEAAQRELDRLEHLYESRLRVLGESLRLGDTLEARRRGRGLEGLAAVVMFRGQGRVEVVDVNGGADWLRPVVEEKDVLAGESVLVDLPVAGLEDAKWTDVPGGGLYFVLRREKEGALVVFVVDRQAVGGALDRWMAEVWMAESAVRPAGGAGRWELASAGGGVLVGGGDGERDGGADFVRGLPTRFGTWRVAAWLPRGVETGYEVPVVAGGVGAGVLCILLGCGLFVQQRRVLREADRRVSFANRVSHELRTPLTNMLLNIDLVADGIGPAPASVSRRLGLVREEGQRLGRLISNAMAFTGKRGSGRGRCVPGEIVRGTVASFEPMLGRRGMAIELSGEAERESELDGDALAQVVGNLLSNVEKYAGEGASAEVLVHDAGGELVVEVRDTGPGIPARDRERVFEPFERLSDRVDEGVSGAGLGLAISRDLAGELGGRLELLPSEAGAAFRLTVPLVGGVGEK